MRVVEGQVLYERPPFRLSEGSHRVQRANGMMATESILIREWTSDADIGFLFPPWKLEQPDTVPQGRTIGLESVRAWDGPRLRWIEPRVDGWSLQRWLTSAGRVDPPQAVVVAESLCRIIDAMHNGCTDTGQPLGRLHPRIDASSVMLTVDGSLQLAHPVFVRLEGAAASTNPNVPDVQPLAGLSPEQALGLPVDRRSHVYQATALLFGLLTGRAPLLAASAFDMYQAIRDSRPPPASDLAPGISATLDALIASGLAKDPSARPVSAGVLADRLAEFRTEAQLPVLWASVTGACRDLGPPTPLGW